MTQHLVQVIDAESFSAATSVSRETMARLLTYEALLRKWQGSINLVASSSLAEIWNRHFLDSAQLVPLAPTARSWVDIGSGAGFPGLVVAILLAGRAGFRMHLVESDQKKSVFMREVIRATGAPAIVHMMRIEEFWTGGEVASPDIISARALAPLPRLLDWTSSFWGKDTIGLFLKGQGAAAELTESAKNWIFDSEAIASQSDPSGTVLKLWGLRHANTGLER
ncbi:16S rRNA (guanine(527)-N(7))-methyltransferase RsmG [Sphingobium sp.]|uniref:16S rRNA (guanine(527)-N(7))-methyltransferase RsmG n=1 Tax=Sphingobium sp. TaxID=1912891 RepID=UPI002CB75D10|nr:16S rRNA (guanine(527)-N(7))-methyltransferase RsmG [Sphingobium sp.]HUD94981.1 16S rRNA (guanine(527)-N(7))-methyltransferase RsmG [Sphingobium sp.]